MFTLIKKRSENLEKDKGDEAVGGGPGIGPGAESDALAGDEDAFDPGRMADHHRKMADFHARHAPVEDSPEEEAGELPEFEATEDEGVETTPAEAFGQEPIAHEAPPPPKKKGPSAFNSFRKGGY